MDLGPDPFRFRGETAAMPPAFLCGAAAARVILTREWLASVFPLTRGEWQTANGGQVGKQGDDGTEPVCAKLPGVVPCRPEHGWYAGFLKRIQLRNNYKNADRQRPGRCRPSILDTFLHSAL